MSVKNTVRTHIEENYNNGETFTVTSIAKATSCKEINVSSAMRFLKDDGVVFFVRKESSYFIYSKTKQEKQK